ncbi:MAG: hypothetical protein HPZ97_09980 [Oscillospiraceae bacterium]|nr:hypothetical protein [Oscillospiraceae bacterium]
MRSNSLNPGFLLFSLDIPSMSRAWVDEKKFCSGFPFLRFAENMSRYWGAFSGFTKFRRPERPTAQKQDKKIAGRSRLQSPRHVKNQLPKRTAGNGFALFLIYPYMFLIKG